MHINNVLIMQLKNIRWNSFRNFHCKEFQLKILLNLILAPIYSQNKLSLFDYHLDFFVLLADDIETMRNPNHYNRFQMVLEHHVHSGHQEKSVIF